jgi:hypothetical protein
MQPSGSYFQFVEKPPTLSPEGAQNPSQECPNGAENGIRFRDIRYTLVPGNGVRGNHLYLNIFLSSSKLRKLCRRADATGRLLWGHLLHTSLGGLRWGLLHCNPMVVSFNFASWLVTQSCMFKLIWGGGGFAASLHSNELLPKPQFHPSLIVVFPCLSNVPPHIPSHVMCF